MPRTHTETHRWAARVRTIQRLPGRMAARVYRGALLNAGQLLQVGGGGAHAAPSGVTTSFRWPRFIIWKGMCTVIVCASAETVEHFPMLLHRGEQ
jgi:hypothetical protein